MDIKSTSRATGKRRIRRGKTSRSPYSMSANRFWVTQGAAFNPIMFSSTLAPVLLNSGTTGTLSTSTALTPTISQFTEYSALSGLWSEVKLIACRVEFSPKTQTLNAATLQDSMYIGTRADVTAASSPSAPTGAQFVENLQNPKVISTYGVRPYMYYMSVPRDLDYSAISNDAPATPTPYAGSPGSVFVYATNLSTNSTNYFSCVLTAVWQLRMRV